MSLELMQMHVDALFRFDPEGRIMAVNQDDGPAPPRLFLGRTPHGNMYRLNRDLPEPLASELKAILASEPVGDDLRQPARTFQDLYDALGADAPVERIWQGPAWRFPERIAQSPGLTTTIVDDPALVQRWFPWLAKELSRGLAQSLPCVAVMEGGDAVSLCFCSRTTSRASEAGVETVEAFRGRGYATAVTAAWARVVRQEGREPLYSTSWDNLASQAVARRLGLVLYGVDLHFR